MTVDNSIPTWSECRLYLDETSEHPATNRRASRSLNSGPWEPTPLAFPLVEVPPPPIEYNPVGFPEEEEGLLPIDPVILLAPKHFSEGDEYEDDTEQWFSKPSTPPTTLTQSSPAFQIPTSYVYNPTLPYLSSVEQINSMSDFQVSQQGTNDPDSITWLNWTGTQWDGNPVDGSSMTNSELCAFLRPHASPYEVRGIRELYYEKMPFADPTAPTVAEVDNWNVEVILHIRRMLGFTAPLVLDARLMLEARWAEERKWTDRWDADYPTINAVGDSWGVCNDGSGGTVDIAGGHCGASFFPNETDRAPYIAAEPYFNNFAKYPELLNYTARVSQAEAVDPTRKTNIPWTMNIAVTMTGFICGEGTTGHAGSFLGRTHLGYAYTTFPPLNSGSNIFRARFKWF